MRRIAVLVETDVSQLSVELINGHISKLVFVDLIWHPSLSKGLDLVNNLLSDWVLLSKFLSSHSTNKKQERHYLHFYFK